MHTKHRKPFRVEPVLASQRRSPQSVAGIAVKTAEAWRLRQILRGLIRLLISRRDRVRGVEQRLRSALMFPLWMILCFVLRLRLRTHGDTEVVAVTEEGHRLNCSLPDVLPLYLYVFGVWEPDMTHYIRSRLQPGDVFVDVGANIGYYTLLGASCVGSAGIVAAVEAAPAIFDQLEDVVRQNGSTAEVRLFNNAASDAPGELTVYSGPSTCTGLSTTVPRGGMPAVAVVAAGTLCDWLTADEISRVRLIKIDIEGGEVLALNGVLKCADLLPRNVEIAVELSPIWWSDQDLSIADLLKPWIDSGFNLYVCPNSYTPERLLWPNDVRRPKRVWNVTALKDAEQVDVVLSRLDREFL